MQKEKEELRPVFISHSGKDQKLVSGIIESFELYNRTASKKRPYIVITKDKLDGSPEPHWRQVKNEIEKSEALVLIISDGITNFEYTQNWVAFEVGIAAGCEPPKPVIAIQATSVRIPMPYITHYYSYSNNVAAAGDDGEEKTMPWHNLFDILMAGPLDKANFKPENPPISCPRCKTSYHYHGPELIIKCPCCPYIIQRDQVREVCSAS